MARTDELEEGSGRVPTLARRSYRWVTPVIGAIVGFLLGTAVITLFAAFMPAGTPAFATLGLTLQTIGALLGLFIGGLLTRSPQ